MLLGDRATEIDHIQELAQTGNKVDASTTCFPGFSGLWPGRRWEDRQTIKTESHPFARRKTFYLGLKRGLKIAAALNLMVGTEQGPVSTSCF